MVAIPPTHPPTTATTAHPQPPPRPVQTPIAYDLARTQQPHATPARPSAAPPPRLGHANGGFYYHRHPATACRRRVTPLWSQFPPRTHPQPPTTRPSNNAAPRTPRATPIHNLTTAAFADPTSTPPAPTGGFTTIDTSPRRVAGVSRPYGRNSPTPDEPKVACNSGARTFYSTPKRCNSNDVMSNLEIHAGELHATFLRNHNMRHHKGPKQKTTQAQKTPTAKGERQPQHSQPAPTGGFTTIDAPPRRVAGVSHPYGRNSPHT